MQFFKDKFPNFFSLINKTVISILIAISIVITMGSWYITDKYNKNLTQHQFDIKVLENIDRMAKRLSHYENALQSGIAFFHGSSYVSRDEWKNFVEALNIPKNYPGIQGIGFVQIVAQQEIDSLENRMQSEGKESFELKPKGIRELYAPVLYLEPVNERNEYAIGYDIFSEPIRRSAGERARDSGKTIITSGIELVQEIDSDVQAGILMMSPLYKLGAHVMTVEQRREAFVGFVDGAFRMNDLMNQIVSKDATLNFEIHDSSTLSADNLLYRSFEPSSYHSDHHVQKQLQLYGQTWTIDFWSTPEFDYETNTLIALSIAATVLIFYLLLIVIIFYILKTKNKFINNALFLRESQNAAEIGSYSLDFESMTWESSQMLDEIFGIDETCVRTFEGWIALIHSEDREWMNEYFKTEVIAGQKPFNREYRIVRQTDHEVRWVHGLGKLQYDSVGTPLKMFGTVQDITQSKLDSTMLLKLQMAVEQSPNSIVITDIEGTLEYTNAMFSKVSGYSREEALGNNPSMLKSDQTPQATYNEMWAYLTSGKTWHGELINKRKDGSFYTESAIISPVKQNNKITHYIAIKEDISDKKRSLEYINQLAHFDQLTGLPNRTTLYNRFKYVLSRAQHENEMFAVMFMDLDHFKNINDSLGHTIGDKLLIEISHRILKNVRDEDTVARLGGDEFIMIFPHTNEAIAITIASKLIEQVSKPLFIDGHELTITPSIGIAMYPNDGKNLEVLLKNADTAMYRVKNDSRNSFNFFTIDMQKNLARNLLLVNVLRHALENKELEVYYQPQVAIEDGHVIGAEALLRWNHPELGMISPAEFIPIAESSGQIIEIGEWVLRTALEQTKIWVESGFSTIVIAVNLSAIQFRQPNFTAKVISILEEIQLDPKHLELELTEAVTMNDPDTAIAIMNTLHDAGIRMSIDDFGTGYSSLSYLKKFKVYKLKIDQSFIQDIQTDADDRAIVSAIIDMASNLGLRTIAEGVESAEQLSFLRLHGCHEVQGYYFSKPLQVQAFTSFLNQEH